MGYCRFENTYGDLQDCYENIDNDPGIMSETEAEYRLLLIKLCKTIASENAD